MMYICLLELDKDVVIIVEEDLGGHGMPAVVQISHSLLTVVVSPVNIEQVLMPVEEKHVLLCHRWLIVLVL